jgi:glycosyltransferase involved in cell wall biosynthesis
MKRYPLTLQFLLWCADTVVAPSQAFLSEVLAVFPRTAPKAIAIHNGIDSEEFRVPAQQAASSQPYLLCIAAHNEKKGLDVLLDAFAETTAAHRDIRLRLVGDGPLRPRLEDHARALGLRDRVEFLGETDRPEVARLLRGCIFFVLPSRAEPFGMVLCEAMLHRKAVLATAVGGIREVVEDGKSGLLVRPNDPRAFAHAMATLLKDDARRESMADTGYKRVLEHFGLARMGDRYLNLFSSLIQGSHAGQGQRLRIPGNTER